MRRKVRKLVEAAKRFARKYNKALSFLALETCKEIVKALIKAMIED